MYRTEVPQYGTLLNLVADINQHTLAHNPALREALAQAGDMDRIDVERHGAIRLGTAHELATLSRLYRATWPTRPLPHAGHAAQAMAAQ